MSVPYAPNPTYAICILDGYVYAYNPVMSKNPPIRSVSRSATLAGNVFTDYGLIQSDRIIEQTWPLMEANVYWQLYAIVEAGGTVPFVDEWETLWPTTIAKSIDYSQTTAGGTCFTNVKLTLWLTQ